MKRRRRLVLVVLIGGPLLVVGDRLLLKPGGGGTPGAALVSAGMAAVAAASGNTPGSVSVADLLKSMSNGGATDPAQLDALFGLASTAPASAGTRPAVTPEAAPAAVGSELRVTAIVHSGNTRVAMIAGGPRREGDDVNGWRVGRIEDRRVVLARGAESLILEMAGPAR